MTYANNDHTIVIGWVGCEQIAKLADKALLEQIDRALRDRENSLYWEPDALTELQTSTQLTAEAVSAALAKEFINRTVAPDIEVQKGGPHDGPERYVWRIKVARIELYLKTRVFLDQHRDPCIEIVRCH